MCKVHYAFIFTVSPFLKTHELKLSRKNNDDKLFKSENNSSR